MKALYISILCASLILPSAAFAEDKGDAVVSPREISKYTQQKYDNREQEMKTFDENKDGILEVDELKDSSTVKFKAADTNGDGFISKDERAASLQKMKSDLPKSYSKPLANGATNRVKNRYKAADLNKDGKVSEEEYQIYMGNYQRNFDQDGDGKISKEEYRMDIEKLPSRYRLDKKHDLRTN